MATNEDILRVVTRFDESTKKVTFQPGGEIHIETETGAVVFELTAANAVPVSPLRSNPTTFFFPSNPIQWVNDSLQPINQPSGTAVHRFSNVGTTIRITASQVPSRSLSFYVIVQTLAGEFFGTDPTIVTMPPGV